MRDFSPEYMAALLDPEAGELFVCEMDFASETLRLTTAPFHVTVDGNQFLAVGEFGGIDKWEEGDDGKLKGWEFSLSGLPSHNIGKALNDGYQGRIARMQHCCIDRAGTVIPSNHWVSSFMDTISIEDSGETSMIIVRVEDPTVRLDTPNDSIYSHEDQQRRYPGDDYYIDKAGMADRNVTF